jgi:hypothetical protein
MSKTLFNQNTFNNKNVTNSNTITDVKVDTLKATNATIINATITNLTNAELQAATAGVAQNASDIADNTTAISTNTSNIATNTSNIATNTSNISTNTSNIATNTSNIATNTSNIATNTSNIATNTSNIATNTSDITDLQNDKQDNISAGDGIDFTSNIVSLDGTRTGGFTITGNYTSYGADFKLWNATRGGSGTSDGRALVHQGSGTQESSVLRINYNGDYGAGTQVDGKLTINPLSTTTQGLIINNPENDTNIVNVIDSLSTFDSFERHISMRHLDSTREFDIGLLSISTNTDPAVALIAFGADGGSSGGDPDIGLAIAPRSGDIYIGGDANIDNDAIIGGDADVGGDLSVVGNITTTTGTITGSVLQYSDGGPVANVKTKIDDLESNKQDNISAGDGIDFTSNVISFDGESVVGNITTTGAITGGTMNYVDGGVVTNIQTKIETNETDIATNTEKLTNISYSSGKTTIGGKFLLNSIESGYVRVRVGQSGTSPARIYFTDDNGDSEVSLNAKTMGLTDNFTCESAGNQITTATYDTALQMDGRRLRITDPPVDTTFTNLISALSSYNSFDYLVEGNVGGYNNVYMGMFRDTTNTESVMAFGVNSSGANPKIGFAVDNGGGAYVGRDLSVGRDLYLTGEFRGGGRRGGIRASLINYDNDSTNSGNFGNNSYFNSINTTESGRLGDSMFSSTTNGILTLSVGGTFRITVYNHGENVNVNDRVVAGTYLSINDGAGDWRGANAGKFGLMYLRDNNYGVGGSCSYACVVQLSSGDSIRIKTKLGVGSDNRAYNDQKTTAQINIWCQVAVELLTENNVIEAL